jgi:hypothetical protein
MADNNQGGAGKIVTAWRTVQKLDSDGWAKLQNGMPLRLTRWAAAVALVGIQWGLSGTPHSAVAWLPALVLAGLLLLPDADSLGFGSFTYKARQEADRAEAAKNEAEQVAENIHAGREVGEAQGEAAQARGTPQPQADEVRKYLQ